MIQILLLALLLKSPLLLGLFITYMKKITIFLVYNKIPLKINVRDHFAKVFFFLI